MLEWADDAPGPAASRTQEGAHQSDHRRRGRAALRVAEIADAANVSVKTLFVYFRSKEELAFADSWLIDSIVSALAERPAGSSGTGAVVGVLTAALDPSDSNPGIAGFNRGFGALRRARVRPAQDVVRLRRPGRRRARPRGRDRGDGGHAARGHPPGRDRAHPHRAGDAERSWAPGRAGLRRFVADWLGTIAE
ncbi:MAG: helix-turn-helix domain-containing protein [Galbitalea sp.]